MKYTEGDEKDPQGAKSEEIASKLEQWSNWHIVVTSFPAVFFIFSTFFIQLASFGSLMLQSLFYFKDGNVWCTSTLRCVTANRTHANTFK